MSLLNGLGLDHTSCVVGPYHRHNHTVCPSWSDDIGMPCTINGASLLFACFRVAYVEEVIAQRRKDIDQRKAGEDDDDAGLFRPVSHCQIWFKDPIFYIQARFGNSRWPPRLVYELLARIPFQSLLVSSFGCVQLAHSWQKLLQMFQARAINLFRKSTVCPLFHFLAVCVTLKPFFTIWADWLRISLFFGLMWGLPGFLC